MINHPQMWAKYKVLFWDFDGVILDSMDVRDKGFEITLADFPDDLVQELIRYHRKNGGLSRYVKFRYFYEELLNEPLSDNQLQQLANRFSEIMLNELGNKNLLINDAVRFLENLPQPFKMHIVSGSDQNELRELCRRLEVTRFFDSIHGSPKPKTEWVAELIEAHHYETKKAALIGDSINDLEAARDNGIEFIGYNNEALRSNSDYYIDTFISSHQK